MTPIPTGQARTATPYNSDSIVTPHQILGAHALIYYLRTETVGDF
ncbi:MAG: hypothetical protein ACR2JG_01650 [Geodermatophilaceae bacterium]